MRNNAQKPWLSPFVAVTYAAVAITGILMLFHRKLPGVHSLHQWGGVLFVVVGTIHLLLNWRVFVSYFTNRKAIWGTAVGVLALILITLVVPVDENGRGERYRGGARNSLQYWENN